MRRCSLQPIRFRDDARRNPPFIQRTYPYVLRTHRRARRTDHRRRGQGTFAHVRPPPDIHHVSHPAILFLLSSLCQNHQHASQKVQWGWLIEVMPDNHMILEIDASCKQSSSGARDPMWRHIQNLSDRQQTAEPGPGDSQPLSANVTTSLQKSKRCATTSRHSSTAQTLTSPSFSPSSPKYSHFENVLPYLQDHLAPNVLIGCSGSGVIGAGRELETGPGLSVLAATCDTNAVHPFAFTDKQASGRDATPGIPCRTLSAPIPKNTKTA